MRNIVKKIFRNIRNFLDCFIIETQYKITNRNKPTPKLSSKNIMILVSRLYNGGAEKVAAIIANEISKKYNLVLVTIEDKNENDYECTATRIVLKENQGKFLVKKNLVKQIRKIKEKYNITHTISLCSKMNYFNVMSKVNDVNIISIRNYLSVSVKEKKYQHINKVSAKYADKIIVVSKQLIEDQVKNFKADNGKIHVIYNYIDEERIDECLIDANIDKNENSIINIGRLSYQKGQLNLIRAFKKVVMIISNAKLYILGQGELKEELEHEIKKLDLEKNVFMLGFQKNPYKFLKEANVFVLSSFYEGMSNAILEAMYCGLPIISTDCKSRYKRNIGS